MTEKSKLNYVEQTDVARHMDDLLSFMPFSSFNLFEIFCISLLDNRLRTFIDKSKKEEVISISL